MAINIPIISEFNSKGIKNAIKEFKSLEGASAKAQFALKKAALPAAAALGALAVAAKGAVAAGEAAATANARIAQINKSMGLFGDTTDAVNQRLIAYANTTARATGIDQNSIKATQAKLLTFGKLAATADKVGGSFDRATKAAIDLAASGFGDAESNAVQLGKALQDPIKGITALNRAGVTFTEVEKEKIKALVESGQHLEAQNMVLAAIEKQVGGTAEATANDSDKMKVAFSQVSESIGLILLPMFQALSKILIQVADFASRNSKVIVILGGVIGGLASAILIANFAMKAFAAGKLAVAAAVFLATKAQLLFNLALTANPIGLVVLAIAALVAAFVLAYNKSETFRKGVQAMFDFVKMAVGASVDLIKGYLEFVLGFYKGIFNGIAKAWNNTIGKLSFKAPDWIPGIGGKGFSVPKIPELADGGIVTGPTLAMIGEAGPEAVIPLSRMNGMGNITININSAVADASLGDIIVNALKQYNRRSGPVQVQIA
jgi:hypothetical protein